jgi:hypothetical protein
MATTATATAATMEAEVQKVLERVFPDPREREREVTSSGGALAALESEIKQLRDTRDDLEEQCESNDNELTSAFHEVFPDQEEREAALEASNELMMQDKKAHGGALGALVWRCMQVQPNCTNNNNNKKRPAPEAHADDADAAADAAETQAAAKKPKKLLNKELTIFPFGCTENRGDGGCRYEAKRRGMLRRRDIEEEGGEEQEEHMQEWEMEDNRLTFMIRRSNSAAAAADGAPADKGILVRGIFTADKKKIQAHVRNEAPTLLLCHSSGTETYGYQPEDHQAGLVLDFPILGAFHTSSSPSPAADDDASPSHADDDDKRCQWWLSSLGCWKCYHDGPVCSFLPLPFTHIA